jgi:hypothetical protein
MAGKVFISCGQRDEGERKIAGEISKWFTEAGYDPYVAIQAQTIQDVNSGIINHLESADYYVFIDFSREEIDRDGDDRWRGSLFTNQELAIAYVLKFDHVIFLQQEGVLVEGLLKYMASNAIRFVDKATVPEKLKSQVITNRWSNTYSRHLFPNGLRWSEEVISYGHPTGTRLTGRFLYGYIVNRRHDLAAFNTVARLSDVTGPDGWQPDQQYKSPLKATGQPGFTQVIWPDDKGEFDLLVVDYSDPETVYLNNALDISPFPPLITRAGRYLLEYEVLAMDFPPLRFKADLRLTGNLETTECKLVPHVS